MRLIIAFYGVRIDLPKSINKELGCWLLEDGPYKFVDLRETQQFLAGVGETIVNWLCLQDMIDKFSRQNVIPILQSLPSMASAREFLVSTYDTCFVHLPPESFVQEMTQTGFTNYVDYHASALQQCTGLTKIKQLEKLTKGVVNELYPE